MALAIFHNQGFKERRNGIDAIKITALATSQKMYTEEESWEEERGGGEGRGKETCERNKIRLTITLLKENAR